MEQENLLISTCHHLHWSQQTFVDAEVPVVNKHCNLIRIMKNIAILAIAGAACLVASCSQQQQQQQQPIPSNPPVVQPMKK
jgi:hypothetical protein